MCQFKSAIILKDRVFIPDYDSHFTMLEELGIKDTTRNAKSKFIRAELIPHNGDMFSPVIDWNFNVDQDILPDWYVEDYDKQRMVESVEEWAKEHIFVGIDNLSFEVTGNDTRTLYFKDCKNINVKSYDTSTANVKSYGTSTVNVKSYDTSTANVESYGTSTANVKSWGTSTANVESCDTSTANVESWGTSTANVKSYGTSTANVKSCDTSTANRLYSSSDSHFTFVVSCNSTFKDHTTKTIYQSGDWKYVIVNQEAK